jgi:DNA replication protein DnaC
MEARVELMLTELRLPSIRCSYRKIGKEVAQAGGNFTTYLHALLEEESRERCSRRVQRRIKEARFPQVKLLAELDAKALPKGAELERLHTLAAGDYLTDGVNVIAIGGSGTGKTHVSIGLGVEACNQGKRVRFYTATELVSELEEAQEAHQLHRYLRRFASWDLTIVDELGYLPMSERSADLLFQACSGRHERGSMIVNSNLPFAEWGQAFRNERLAVALLDRLTHRAEILEMNGESYRLRSARKRTDRK